jgi:uncharacterized protein YggE
MARLLAALALPALLLAQTAPMRRVVRAYGEGSVSLRPDYARVSVSVVTQARTAQEAAAENAARAQTVIDQLRSALGSGAEIRTASYSLTPNYSSPGPGQQPVLVGFTAINVVEVGIADVNATGRIIDTAISAGASRVDGLRLTIKDEEPPRAQALRLAGQKARARAEAIAAGLNVRLGQVLTAEEGVSYRPIPVDIRTTAPTTTPVETGTLDVHATVTLEIEILP